MSTLGHLIIPSIFLGIVKGDFSENGMVSSGLVVATRIPVRNKFNETVCNQNMARCIRVHGIKDHLLSVVAKLPRVTEVSRPIAQELGITADPVGGVVF